MIKIKFFSTLRQAAGCDDVDLQAATVSEAVHGLKQRFSGNEKFLNQLKVSNAILNGSNVTFIQGPATILKDGDELVFFPPLGGG